MIDHIVNYLTASAELRESIGMPEGQQCFERWLLENGEPFTDKCDLPADLPRRYREANQCYANAASALMTNYLDQDDWVYTEGVACRPDLGIVLDHAWVVNRHTRQVLDFTWEGPVFYYGIPYDYDTMIDQLLRREVYGLHSNGHMYNRELMGLKPTAYRAWDKVQ